MLSLEKVKEQVKVYTKEITEEPIKTLAVVLGAAIVLSKVIPGRCNHHVYLHVVHK